MLKNGRELFTTIISIQVIKHTSIVHLENMYFNPICTYVARALTKWQVYI